MISWKINAVNLPEHAQPVFINLLPQKSPSAFRGLHSKETNPRYELGLGIYKFWFSKFLLFPILNSVLHISAAIWFS